MKYLALIALVALVAGTQAVHREQRDPRDELVRDARSLFPSLKLAITTMRQANRTKEADLLASEEKELKTLTGELLKVDPHHDNQHKLQDLQNKLAALEARASSHLRQLIIDNFGNLGEVVEKKIKELKQQDYHDFAEDLQGQLKEISVLVKQLNATTEHKKILKLEEFRHFYQRLDSDLDILRRNLPAYQLILNSTETLLADAEHVVEELKARNLTQLVKILNYDVKELAVARDQLKREKVIMVYGYLQDKLVNLEKHLQQNLVAIRKRLHSGHERTRRDAPNDVLENSAKLLNAARQAIEKLKAEGKHELAAGLEKIEKVLIDIDSQVRNLHPHTALGRAALEGLEGLLKKAEDALEAELKRLGIDN